MHEHVDLGPYIDENYFTSIKTDVVKMKKDHPDWKPNESNSNEDKINWDTIENK